MIFSGTKDGTNYGFYLENYDLQNCVELTDDEHMALFDGQSTGKVIVWDEKGVPFLADPPEPTEAEIGEQVRNKRDRLIEEIQWRIERYRQQVMLSSETSDTAAWYESALHYIQALRDVPSQKDFPYQIDWPEIPT